MESRSVLLVEDNEDLRLLAAELLEEEGFHVQVASTGLEALTLLRDGIRPGCMLLDLGLPDMSAADFLAQYLEIPGAEEIPVVLVSGNSELGSWAEKFKTGRMIRKPYGLDALLEAATELCGGGRLVTVLASTT